MFRKLREKFSSSKNKEFIITKKKLDSTLDMASILIHEAASAENVKPIFWLIKILADSLVYPNVVETIETQESTVDGIESLFFAPTAEMNNKHQLLKRIYDDTMCKEIQSAVVINLRTDPFISFPWNWSRIESALRKIGTEENPWKEDTRNHFATLYLPMGISYFYNGIHSSFVGFLKGDGQIEFSSKSKHQICDYTETYDYIKFDGTNYIYTPTNEIAGKAKNFEFGCLFEIGRMMMEENISFKDL